MGYTSPMEINERLIWDYEFTEQDRQGNYFRDWYVARVLSRGTMADIRNVGLQTIHDRLSHIFLPKKIRIFWEWYFSLPEVQICYGRLDAPPKDLPA